jgi:hypothetical protein
MIKFVIQKPLFAKSLASALLIWFAADNRLLATQEGSEPIADDNVVTTHEYPSSLEELKGQIFRLQAEIAVLRQQLGPDHPRMKLSETRLQVFEQLYDEHQKHAAVQAEAQEAEQLPRVFPLQYISATNAERVIRELYPAEQYSLASDERTNTLILRANDEFREIVETLITRLEETTATTEKRSTADLLFVPESKPAAAESVAQMKQQASDLDLNAQKFAADMKDHLQSGKGTAEEIEKLKQQLRDAVTQSFDTRQQLKRAELQLMEARLKQLKASIELREQLASKLIDRRVEELLGGTALSFDRFPSSYAVETYILDDQTDLTSLLSGPQIPTTKFDETLQKLVQVGKCTKIAGSSLISTTTDQQKLVIPFTSNPDEATLTISMTCRDVTDNHSVTMLADYNKSRSTSTIRLPLSGNAAYVVVPSGPGGHSFCIAVVSRTEGQSPMQSEASQSH